MKAKYYKDEYPATVAEIIEDVNYKKDTHLAIEKFKNSHPWKGKENEIREKFKSLLCDLSKIYKIEEPEMVFLKKFAYGSCYFPIDNLIVMTKERDGSYSVITFLHEFSHALGMNERGACRWSINLFRKHFPNSFKKLDPRGHLLYKKD